MIEVPVEGGGRLLVQAGPEAAAGLEPATRGVGMTIARAKESVQAAMDQIKPGLKIVLDHLKDMAADEVGVEFGVVLGAEVGAIIAKGSAEAHFTVTLAWKKAGPATNNALGANQNSLDAQP